jgi:tRNA/rRNA methyltransferase
MKLRFILVEPKVPENIGASARALKTMGHESLILVNPKCSLTNEALWVAHGSNEIVREAPVFQTLREALEGSDFSVATTAKGRSVRRDPVSSEALHDFLHEKRLPDETVSVVFGREESGLTNEEISMCDISAYIPMQQLYPSLNLSHAVMIFAYELARLQSNETRDDNRPVQEESMSILKGMASSILPALDIPEDGALYGRILERLSYLSPSDVRLMLSIASRLTGKSHHGFRNGPESSKNQK